MPNCLQCWCHAFDALITQRSQGLFHFSVVYSVSTASSCLFHFKEKRLWMPSAPQMVCEFVSNTCAHLALPLMVGLQMEEHFSTRTTGTILHASIFPVLYVPSSSLRRRQSLPTYGTASRVFIVLLFCRQHSPGQPRPRKRE